MLSSISLGSLVALAGVGLGTMYVMSPYKVKVIAPYPFANGTTVELDKTLTGRYGDLQPDLVTTPGEVKPLVRSTHPSANDWYGGGHMGDFVQPDKGTTVFENYWDDFSQQQINKTKVIPRNKRVKSLKGNNGDFNMDDPDIFAYINNNNNDKSSFWT